MISSLTDIFRKTSEFFKETSHNFTIYDLEMVYTIKFKQDKPPAYNQATTSTENRTKEIKTKKATPKSKDVRKRCCAIPAIVFLCGIVAFAFIGTFKKNYISLYRFLLPYYQIY